MKSKGQWISHVEGEIIARNRELLKCIDETKKKTQAKPTYAYISEGDIMYHV